MSVETDEHIQMEGATLLSELLRERNRRELKLQEAELELQACLAAVGIAAAEARPRCENEPPREPVKPPERVAKYLRRLRPGKHGTWL